MTAPADDITDEDVPAHLRCSICLCAFEIPVWTSDGQMYCYKCINQWFQYNDTSPLTNIVLMDKKLIYDESVDGEILVWRARASIKIKQQLDELEPRINDSSNKLQINKSSFPAHMTLSEADKLRVNDKIDHRDGVGRFVYATVLEKQHTNLKIHYNGWSGKWDTWSDYEKELHRFAKPGTISKRPSHRFIYLKEGDYVDINPIQRHPGWKWGVIRHLDHKSGQVGVVYDSADKNYLYWAHLDNKSEITEFTRMAGTLNESYL